jgi:hypothetical protein
VGFINNIKVFAYMQSWVGKADVESLVLQTEKHFQDYGQEYKVINTTDKVYNKENWIDVGNKWGYHSFYTAIKDFDMSYDYMLYMSGDVDGAKIGWDKILDRSYEILNKYDIWCYSFEKAINIMPNAYLKPVENDKFLYYSVTNDLTIAWYHRDLVKLLLDFFKYFEERSDLLNEFPNWGWGIDLSSSCLCFLNNKVLLKDTKYKLEKISMSTPYVMKKAIKQEWVYFKIFNEHTEKNGMDSRSIMEKQFLFMSGKTIMKKGKPYKLFYGQDIILEDFFNNNVPDILRK